MLAFLYICLLPVLSCCNSPLHVFILTCSSGFLLLLARSLQVLEINKRVQRQNNSPNGFPNFVRLGFDLKVVADGYTKHPDGFIYRVRGLWDGASCMAEQVPARKALSCRRAAETQPAD